MILNQDESKVNIVGEVQSNKVGIDTNNINFITNLLTSKLYSKPIQSFLRETVSNAWDSQVEAGNTNTPILIKIDKVENNDDDVEISVRDYGTGISPERFDSIYRNIGSSTKRTSNDYIGMMGIGRFAALAVNDTVGIKSYYNGKLYNYLMYKDGEELNIDLLNVSDTEYENGVEVKTYINDAFSNYGNIVEGLSSLAYFEQIYISNTYYPLKSFVNKFNERKIHEFDTFKVCSLMEVDGLKFLMGNVLYDYNNTNDVLSFRNCPNIAIKCNIGEIDITPNRENIRFSDKTKGVVKDKLEKVKKEIFEIIKYNTNRNFDTIEDWYKIVANRYLTIELWKFSQDNTINVEVYNDVLINNNVTKNWKIRGIVIPDGFKYHYYFIRNLTIRGIYITYNYFNERFCKGSDIALQTLVDIAKKGDLYKIKNIFNKTTKSYIRETRDIDNLLFIKEESFSKIAKDIFNNYIKWIKCESGRLSRNAYTIIKEDLLSIFKDIKSFNNSDVPKEWLDANKITVCNSRRSFVIHKIYLGSRGVTSTPDLSLNDILSEKRTIIYDTLKSEYLRLVFRLINSSIYSNKYMFVEVAKNGIDNLKRYKQCISIYDFTTKYQRSLSNIFTGKYIHSEIDECVYRYCTDDSYSNIVSLYNKYVRADSTILINDKKDLKELYEYYISKNWLNVSMIESMMNDDFIKYGKFLHRIGPNRYLRGMSEIIAINYFVYKHNIKIGNINKINAYKVLKRI
jgi:hypothetical protein